MQHRLVQIAIPNTLRSLFKGKAIPIEFSFFFFYRAIDHVRSLYIDRNVGKVFFTHTKRLQNITGNDL